MEAVTLERTLTELGHARLLNLHRHDVRGDGSPQQVHAIEDVLGAAALVPSSEVSPDVVTMYSQVLLQDPHTGQRHTLALCYPADAEPAAEILAILFQPESSGDYAT